LAWAASRCSAIFCSAAPTHRSEAARRGNPPGHRPERQFRILVGRLRVDHDVGAPNEMTGRCPDGAAGKSTGPDAGRNSRAIGQRRPARTAVHGRGATRPALSKPPSASETSAYTKSCPLFSLTSVDASQCVSWESQCSSLRSFSGSACCSGEDRGAVAHRFSRRRTQAKWHLLICRFRNPPAPRPGRTGTCPVARSPKKRCRICRARSAAREVAP